MVEGQVDGMLRVHLVEGGAVVRHRAAVLRVADAVDVGGRAAAQHAQRRRLVDDDGLVAVEGERRDGLRHELRRVDHGRQERAAVRRVVARCRQRRRLRALREEVRARELRRRRRSRRRHGVLAHVEAEAGLRVDTQIRSHGLQGIGLLRDRRVDGRVVWLGLRLARLLDVEGRHGRVQHGEVDRHGDGPASLPLVARTAATHVRRQPNCPLLLLEHADVRLGEVWLRRRPCSRRDRSRRGQILWMLELGRYVMHVVPVHEGLKGHELRELSAQHLRVPA